MTTRQQDRRAIEKRRTLDRKQARSLKRGARDTFLTRLEAEERAKPAAQRRAEAEERRIMSDALGAA